jgi:hypothetical protein
LSSRTFCFRRTLCFRRLLDNFNHFYLLHELEQLLDQLTPGITFPPSLSISVSISGTLPPWPSVTIGPDNLPTYEPKPTDGPDDGCKTESAEVCLTSTSFGVDTATVTTTSSVLSTCATIFGCDVTDSASSTATTSTASSSDYPYSLLGFQECNANCITMVDDNDL